MGFPWMALATGLGGILGFAGQQSANAQAAESAQKQMDFQERMSNTAHQREVKDLADAGLNPILSATGGSGASSPVGAAFTPVNPAAGLARDFASAAGAYNQQRLADADISLKDTSSAVNKSLVVKNAADTKVADAQALNISSQTLLNNVDYLYRAKLHDLSIRKGDAEIKYMSEQTATQLRQQAFLEAQAVAAIAQAGFYGSSSANQFQQIQESISRQGLIGAQTKEVEYRFPRLSNEANYQTKSFMAPFLPYVRDMVQSISPFSGTMNVR